MPFLVLLAEMAIADYMKYVLAELLIQDTTLH